MGWPDAIGGEGELSRERYVTGAELEGFSDYLVVDGLVTLSDSCPTLREGDARCNNRQDRQHGEDGKTAVPPPGAAARGVLSGAEERPTGGG